MMRDSERPELEDVAEEEDVLAGLEHSRSAQESGVSQVCAALLPCLPRTGAAAAGCRVRQQAFIGNNRCVLISGTQTERAEGG